MSRTFIEAYLGGSNLSGDLPALTWADGEWSHAQLQDKIKRRTTWLTDKGFEPGDRLALSLPKGPVAIEFLLAGFATGLIVVPIDPLSPSGRLDMILSEISPRLLVCDADIQENYLSDHPTTKIDVLVQDPFESDNFAKPNVSPLELDETSPALILMTSGSTGTPKGITLSHQNIAAFVNWTIKTFEFTADDRFISIAPLHFDLSMLDVYASLQQGASVYLLSETEMSFPGNIAKALQEHAITVIYTVPSMLQILLRFRVFETISPMTLRAVLFAGEVFPLQALKSLMAQIPDAQFANLYGPTETNVISYHRVRDIPDNWESLPIGIPCDYANLKVYNAQGEVLPAGMSGEICAKGPSVMRGYWHNHGIKPIAKYGDHFRTGDFGYFDEDGVLHYAGRQDDMVKIRGLRFNLQDIEKTALSSPAITQAAAIVVDAGTLKASITLYVVARDQAEFDKDRLLGDMKKRIPGATLPRQVTVLDALPQNSNGKIDRQKLLHMANNA